MHAAEQDRADVKAARRAWFEGQMDLDPGRLVFLDESAATTTMARRHGRAPRGQRCRLPVPLGHRCTTTVTAALRTTGLLATTLFEGATNRVRFLQYVRGTLVPALRPGDTVVMDNLPVHKVGGVRKAIEAAGARLLFLDAYNHARRLKALRGLTPYEFTCQVWTREPDRFRIDPSHHTPGLNT